MFIKKYLIASLGLASLLAVAGCSQRTINSANSDINHDVNVAGTKVDQVAQKAKPALTDLDLGTRVTTAIEANQNLPHGSIRVDANPHGVRLKGDVKTAEQKHLAGEVAKDTLGPGKTVQNDLNVTGS